VNVQSNDFTGIADAGQMRWFLRNRRTPSAGHQSPRHNGHENGYTYHITQEPSVLKFFMIYHGKASQEDSYYDTDPDHSARRKHDESSLEFLHS
jgi:hypothetical protein